MINRRCVILGISLVVISLAVLVLACTPSLPQTSTAPPPPQVMPAAPARTYALPGDQVFPDGVAYDHTSNSFFTGSTNDGTVFSAGGTDGRTAAIGMKVDIKTRRLWITVALPA